MLAGQILDEIERIFPNAECELLHETPFQLLIAVTLSAQTTDASVNKCTPDLFRDYGTPDKMAAATSSELEPYIRTIGLYKTKARNINQLAKQLVERFNGEVPESMRELTSLPGVGRKTANVVRSVAFDIPSFAVDTHVERVSKRLGLAKPQDNVVKVEEKLKRKIDRSRWNQAHHDMIFFGRYLCQARNPQCERCPFQAICKREKWHLK